MTERPTPSWQPAGRRLTLTPIGLDVVAALAHDPEGLRLAAIADAASSPASSVQAALRILLANGLVGRDRSVPPRYSLTTHPAVEALVEVALLVAEPSHAIQVVLRSSSAVVLAVGDRDGFVAAVSDAAPSAAVERLHASLSAISGARPDHPPLQLLSTADLSQRLRTSVPFRARLTSAAPLKGGLGDTRVDSAPRPDVAVESPSR